MMKVKIHLRQLMEQMGLDPADVRASIAADTSVRRRYGVLRIYRQPIRLCPRVVSKLRSWLTSKT